MQSEVFSSHMLLSAGTQKAEQPPTPWRPFPMLPAQNMLQRRFYGPSYRVNHKRAEEQSLISGVPQQLDEGR